MEEEKAKFDSQMGLLNVWMQTRKGLQSSQSHSGLTLRDSSQGTSYQWASGGTPGHPLSEIQADLQTALSDLAGWLGARKERD